MAASCESLEKTRKKTEKKKMSKQKAKSEEDLVKKRDGIQAVNKNESLAWTYSLAAQNVWSYEWALCHVYGAK